MAHDLLAIVVYINMHWPIRYSPSNSNTIKFKEGVFLKCIPGGDIGSDRLLRLDVGTWVTRRRDPK